MTRSPRPDFGRFGSAARANKLLQRISERKTPSFISPDTFLSFTWFASDPSASGLPPHGTDRAFYLPSALVAAPASLL